MNRLVITEKVVLLKDDYQYPFKAIIINTKTRKKKRVYIHNREELKFHLNKEIK